MEKQLCTVSHWIGIVSAVLALIMRGLAIVGVPVFPASPGRNPISYHTFLAGAILFFVMAIASSVIMSAKSPKS